LDEDFGQFVYTLGGDAIKKFESAGINTILSKYQYRDALQTIKILGEIVNIVKKQKIDIIHSHHRYFDFLSYLISKFIEVRTITSVQSKVYGRKKLSYRSEILVACSNSIKEHLTNYFMIDPSKIRIIYNFVDVTEIKIQVDELTLKRDLSISSDSVVIGFIGRFNFREKGIDILLESFKKLSFEFNHVKLLLIGEGEDMRFMSDFINTYNLNAIILPPMVNIFDYYNVIDIVVLPSRIEPFGIVAIEAGIMKKALIASSVDGLNEIINTGLNGYLVPSESVESLTNKLNDLVSNPELRKKLGEELYLRVINNFTGETNLPKYKKVYEELM
jgi:glycosyltransferase involved in cell wall biosynthesis